MTALLEQYKLLLLEHEKVAANTPAYDDIIGRLDECWYSMTDAEQAITYREDFFATVGVE